MGGINMAFTGLSRTAPFASSGAQKLIVCPRGSTVAHAAELAGKLKLYVEAGKANPSPPVGPMLGSRGINIMAFCKEYNALTKDKKGMVPVEISYFMDKTIKLELKTPPAPFLVKKAVGVEKGVMNPAREKCGTITGAQIEEIAKVKLPDMNTKELEKAMSQIEGTCKGMGVKFEDGYEKKGP